MTENYTALYEQHKKAGASFTDFGGWQMPLKYESELAEHHAVRNAAGLFDLSHMGEVWVSGPDAAGFLDYALVGKLSAIAVGKAKYSHGDFRVENSPLRNAPHTAAAVVSSDWDRAYPREQGAFPVLQLKQDKYFPPVGRIDGAAGDRNLICSCPPLESFEDNTAAFEN